MSPSHRGLSVAVLANVALSATPGWAQSTAVRPRPTMASESVTSAAPAPGDARERAKLLFEQGAAAYSAGRYFEAIDIFLETQRVYPTPLLSFNIGKAYDNAGNQSGALRFYREYLRGAPDAPDAPEVATKVGELEAALAARGLQQVTVLSEPQGATLLLDEEPVGVTPWTGEAAPGKYLVSLRHDGFEDKTAVLELDGGKSAELELALVAKPKLEPVAKAAPAPDANWPTNRVGTLTWTSLAVGGAALAGALVVEATSRGAERGFTRGGAFLAGVGTAFTLTGGALLCLDLCSSGSAGELGVEVSVGPSVARASYRATF